MHRKVDEAQHLVQAADAKDRQVRIKVSDGVAHLHGQFVLRAVRSRHQHEGEE